jgi:hypothetical protein
VTREESASPATGSLTLHQKEQEGLGKGRIPGESLILRALFLRLSPGQTHCS